MTIDDILLAATLETAALTCELCEAKAYDKDDSIDYPKYIDGKWFHVSSDGDKVPCGADIWGAYIDGYPKEVITN